MRNRIRVNGVLYEAREDGSEAFKEALQKYLEGLSDEDKVGVWLDYCASAGTYDSVHYTKDEFSEIYGGTSRSDLVRYLFSGKFDPDQKYFWIDDWTASKLYSADRLEDTPIDFHYVVDHVAYDMDDMDNPEIEHFIRSVWRGDVE